MLSVAGRHPDCSTKVLRKISEDILTVSEDSTNEIHILLLLLLLLLFFIQVVHHYMPGTNHTSRV